MINYSDELTDRAKVSALVKQLSPEAKVYFSHYRIKHFIDWQGNLIDFTTIQTKRMAAFSAIGYPQGFFNKLKQAGLQIKKEVTYPDHHQLSSGEYMAVEKELLSEGIYDLIISAKDRYHFPDCEFKLNIIVMEIEMQIEQETDFLKEVRGKLSGM